MRVALISCWFRNHLYSDYALELKDALEGEGVEVQVVTGDCICAESNGASFTNLVDGSCRLTEVKYLPNPKGPVQSLKAIRKFGRDWKIGQAYRDAAYGADVIHFQESTNAFGTTPALSLLAGPSEARRVVTLHELERFTRRFRRLYRLYNRADALIVHSKILKNELIELGVDERRIHIVPFGVRVASVIPDRRSGLIYYGGHHPFSGKGFDDFLQALVLLETGGEPVHATVLGYFMPGDWDRAREQARQLGLEDRITWFNHPDRATFAEAFANSALAVIPFVRGSTAFPCALALAHGTPVVATRTLETPEYLGTLARYVEPGSPVQLAGAIGEMLLREEFRAELGRRMLERARKVCDWSAVAQRTLAIYRGEEAFLEPDPWEAAEEVLV